MLSISYSNSSSLQATIVGLSPYFVHHHWLLPPSGIAVNPSLVMAPAHRRRILFTVAKIMAKNIIRTRRFESTDFQMHHLETLAKS
ncbi:hypothetical protein Nepgr_019744 [Nepenthes gracilis]|uniref:Uncharacterized protein n=1 Tax=Nepenthes gracilis TaxID=150966 RepID=A0AAD3SUM8_NEPGR|nr:hypothetical protein Nepgr_019744 [Nepenthes gracilis]